MLVPALFGSSISRSNVRLRKTRFLGRNLIHCFRSVLPCGSCWGGEGELMGGIH